MNPESSEMPVGPVPSPAVAKWPWLDRMVDASWFLVALALYLGILAFAAVAEIGVECRNETGYLLTEPGKALMLEDGTSHLLLKPERRQCRLAWRGR